MGTPHSVRRRALATFAALAAAGMISLIPAYASTYRAVGPVDVSGGEDPFANCTADNVPQQEADFGSTLYPAAEPEPRLAIDPTNSQNLVGVFQQDRWSDGASRGLVAAVSHNGGRSWTRVVVPGLTACSGGSDIRASDPWVSFAADGTLYAIGQTSISPGSPGAIRVSRSTTKGDSWSSPTTLIADSYLASFNDKESITADPTSAGKAYAVWDRFISPPSGNASFQGIVHSRVFRTQTYFARTTDGGASWEPARAIYPPGTDSGTVGNIITVLPNGDLVDGFLESTLKPKPQTFTTKSADIAVIRSSDKGVHWGNIPSVIASLDLSYLGPFDPDTGNPIRSGELPDFAADSTSGTMYAVWEDDAPVAGIDAIQFSQSTDGGVTWSAPVKINRTPSSVPLGDQQAFTPTVKVASDGTVGVTYYDLRQNTAAAGLSTDYWFIHCHASCTSPGSWSENRVAGPFDLEQAAFAGGYFLGDYQGLVTNGTIFEAFFGQAVSQAAGNPSDVYFATLSPR
jgi:hypothetical protein